MCRCEMTAAMPEGGWTEKGMGFEKVVFLVDGNDKGGREYEFTCPHKYLDTSAYGAGENPPV